MKGFLIGVAVTILVIAAFPSVGRWVTTMPYRTAAMFGYSAPSPASWQGQGRGGGRMGDGHARNMPAGYWQ